MVLQLFMMNTEHGIQMRSIVWIHMRTQSFIKTSTQWNYESGEQLSICPACDPWSSSQRIFFFFWSILNCFVFSYLMEYKDRDELACLTILGYRLISSNLTACGVLLCSMWSLLSLFFHSLVHKHFLDFFLHMINICHHNFKIKTCPSLLFLMQMK